MLKFPIWNVPKVLLKLAVSKKQTYDAARPLTMLGIIVPAKTAIVP